MENEFTPPGYEDVLYAIHKLGFSMFGDLWIDVVGRLYPNKEDPDEEDTESAPSLIAVGHLIDKKIEDRKKAEAQFYELHSIVVSSMRRDLYEGRLSAVLQADDGREIPMPHWAWASVDAIDNLRMKRATFKYRVVNEWVEERGRLLFRKKQVDSWSPPRPEPGSLAAALLAWNPDGTISSYPEAEKTITAEPMAVDLEPRPISVAALDQWLDGHVRDLKAQENPAGQLGVDPMWQAAKRAHPHMHISLRAFKAARQKRVDDGTIPSTWTKPGRPPKKNSDA